MTAPQFWKRKATLLLTKGDRALDLSDLRFTFRTSQADLQSPSNCYIRVYNMTQETMAQAQEEFGDVVVQAGYEENYGVIFQGQIRWFHKGMEGAKDTYLDILAADGDLGYNNAIINRSLAKGSSVKDRVDALSQAFGALGLGMGHDGITPGDAQALSRGKVMFGLARTAMNTVTRTAGATWSIQNGKINIIPLDGYLPGERVVLNRDTGLIGRPEQTQEGIRARSLLNPRLNCGGLIQIDQTSINKVIAAKANKASLAYNSWTEPLYVADTSADGIYRLYVVEHSGDTMGQPWYSDLVCLRADRTSLKVKPYG